MAYTTIDKPTDYVQCIGWETAGTNSSSAGDTYTLTTNFGWIPDMFIHYNRGDAIHVLAPFMHYNGSSGSQRSNIQTDYSNLGKCELAAAAPSYESGQTGYASAASTNSITFTHGTHGDPGGSSKAVHFKQTNGTFVEKPDITINKEFNEENSETKYIITTAKLKAIMLYIKDFGYTINYF